MNRPADRGQPARRSTARPDLERGPLRATGHTASHHGRRRELLRAAMLLPHAAAWQPSRVGSKAASARLLPPTECSLRSGCTVDARHGVGMNNNTMRGRGRAIKLTCASLSVGQHSATAPAIVRARVYLSAAGFATLLPARRLATPATP